MSLVGPRPALRREVDAFPVELHRRHQVRPGMTGLWQVEARDNPAFDAYRRLDLFYVENWSLALDLVIILGTIEQLVLRPFHRRGREATAARRHRGHDGDRRLTRSTRPLPGVKLRA